MSGLPSSKKAVLSLFLVAVVSFVLVGQMHAQVAGATLKGTVTDPTGAAVPKAQVTVIDVATGITHNVTTDSAGVYAAPNLQPGVYQVRVVAPGFSDREGHAGSLQSSRVHQNRERDHGKGLNRHYCGSR